MEHNRLVAFFSHVMRYEVVSFILDVIKEAPDPLSSKNGDERVPRYRLWGACSWDAIVRRDFLHL